MSGELYRVPAADLASLVPELLLSGAGVAVLLLVSFLPAARRLAGPLAALAVAAAAWWAWPGLTAPARAGFHGLLSASPVTAAATLLVLATALISVFASNGYLARQRLRPGEYYALLLWAAAGMLLMARATELVTLFVALELLSICLYSLAAYQREVPLSLEAGIKYFLLGAFVSSFVVLGIGLVYGETGSTELAALAAAWELAPPAAPARVGLLLLLAGFGFKMTLAPFHAWAPDTYQGAPSPFVAFLSVAPKVASAIVLLRIVEALPAAGNWSQLVAVLAVLSMVVGNLLALAQRDIKRMLAYSGVAHMGYLLVPLAAYSPAAAEPVLVYLLAYALMNAGAFAVVTLLYRRAGDPHLIADLGSWGYRFPLLGICLTVLMLSLGGIPPTLGFIGKYAVFVYALDAGRLDLALVVVATSLIGVYYYLRVVYTLYMRPPVREADVPRDAWARLAVIGATLGTLVLGLWPSPVFGWIAGVLDGLS